MQLFIYIGIKTIIDQIAEITGDDKVYLNIFNAVEGKEKEILGKLLK